MPRAKKNKQTSTTVSSTNKSSSDSNSNQSHTNNNALKLKIEKAKQQIDRIQGILGNIQIQDQISSPSNTENVKELNTTPDKINNDSEQVSQPTAICSKDAGPSKPPNIEMNNPIEKKKRNRNKNKKKLTVESSDSSNDKPIILNASEVGITNTNEDTIGIVTDGDDINDINIDLPGSSKINVIEVSHQINTEIVSKIDKIQIPIEPSTISENIKCSDDTGKVSRNKKHKKKNASANKVVLEGNRKIEFENKEVLIDITDETPTDNETNRDATKMNSPNSEYPDISIMDMEVNKNKYKLEKNETVDKSSNSNDHDVTVLEEENKITSVDPVDVLFVNDTATNTNSSKSLDISPPKKVEQKKVKKGKCKSDKNNENEIVVIDPTIKTNFDFEVTQITTEAISITETVNISSPTLDKSIDIQQVQPNKVFDAEPSINESTKHLVQVSGDKQLVSMEKGKKKEIEPESILDEFPGCETCGNDSFPTSSNFTENKPKLAQTDNVPDAKQIVPIEKDTNRKKDKKQASKVNKGSAKQSKIQCDIKPVCETPVTDCSTVEVTKTSIQQKDKTEPHNVERETIDCSIDCIETSSNKNEPQIESSDKEGPSLNDTKVDYCISEKHDKEDDKSESGNQPTSHTENKSTEIMVDTNVSGIDDDIVRQEHIEDNTNDNSIKEILLGPVSDTLPSVSSKCTSKSNKTKDKKRKTPKNSDQQSGEIKIDYNNNYLLQDTENLIQTSVSYVCNIQPEVNADLPISDLTTNNNSIELSPVDSIISEDLPQIDKVLEVSNQLLANASYFTEQSDKCESINEVTFTKQIFEILETSNSNADKQTTNEVTYDGNLEVPETQEAIKMETEDALNTKDLSVTTDQNKNDVDVKSQKTKFRKPNNKKLTIFNDLSDKTESIEINQPKNNIKELEIKDPKLLSEENLEINLIKKLLNAVSEKPPDPDIDLDNQQINYPNEKLSLNISTASQCLDELINMPPTPVTTPVILNEQNKSDEQIVTELLENSILKLSDSSIIETQQKMESIEKIKPNKPTKKNKSIPEKESASKSGKDKKFGKPKEKSSLKESLKDQPVTYEINTNLISTSMMIDETSNSSNTMPDREDDDQKSLLNSNYSDSKNVQRSDFVQSVNDQSTMDNRIKSLRKSEKHEIIHQSPEKEKEEKTRINTEQIRESECEKNTRDLPEKTRQEKLDPIQFNDVQLIDILNASMVTTSSDKKQCSGCGNSSGTIRKIIKPSKIEKKFMKSKAIVDASVEMVESIGYEEILSTALNKKPKLAPKPQLEPFKIPSTKITDRKLETSKSSTIKPKVPPKPLHLLNLRRSPKISPASISPRSPISPLKSPIRDDDDDAEFIEYKFTPREVFICTICQVCKIALQNDRVNCNLCQMVSYCSEQHLQDDHHNHQQLCCVIQEIARKRGGHVYNNARILNDDDFRSLRVHTLNICENVLKRHLHPFEREILLFPRLCCRTTCREWREQLLEDCKACGQVSYCLNHPEHLQSEHQKWCTSYSLYHKLVVQQKRHGRIEPQLPFKIMLKPYYLKDNIDDVFKDLFMNTNVSDDECLYATLTQLATAPLTALYGSQKTGQIIGDIYTIHIIGAELQFEADTLDKWETFFLHLVPQLLELRIVFIGPELNMENLPVEILSRIRMCKGCRQLCKIVKFEFQCGTFYHDFVDMVNFSKPNLICYFNPGLYRTTGFNGLDTWPSTMRKSLEFGVPIIITSYTEIESPQDFDRIKFESDRELLVKQLPQQNPFASQRPERNFISDEYTPMIFKNFYYFIVQ